MKYLLPCECGQQIPVERAQAGLEVRCVCGRVQTAPTLRGLAQLRRDTATPAARPAEAWELRQALIFLGFLVAVPAGFFAGLMHWQRPLEYPAYTVQSAENLAYIEGLSMPQLFELWSQYDQGFDSSDDPRLSQYMQFAQNIRLWSWVVTFLAGAGLCLALVGFVLPGAKKTSATRR